MTFAGAGDLAAGGSYLTMTSPNGSDFVTVIETGRASCAHCRYAPSTASAAPQEVALTLAGTLASAKLVHVWQTTADDMFAYKGEGPLTSFVWGMFECEAVNSIFFAPARVRLMGTRVVKLTQSCQETCQPDCHATVSLLRDGACRGRRGDARRDPRVHLLDHHAAWPAARPGQKRASPLGPISCHVRGVIQSLAALACAYMYARTRTRTRTHCN